MRIIHHLLAAFLAVLWTQTAHSQTTLQSDGAVIWQAGVDGIEVEWKADGTIRRISSRNSTPVEFADTRGVYKAQVIAEEKAKAAVVRFMNQTTTSSRVVAELQSDLNRATQERKTGTKPSITKVDERLLSESLVEITTSFSSGELKGVVVLEKGYDEKKQEAWVVVGISENSIAAARGIRNMTRDALRPSDSDGLTKPSGDVRRTNNKDW